MNKFILQKIISGGQTGADRAALDFARTHGLAHGGWCPAGRTAEDGVIDWRYRLKETPSPSYAQRTEWNVRDSDGTVIFSTRKELIGGSQLTAHFATQHRKPCLHLSKEADAENAATRLREFIEENKIQTLNVAGPRASTEPDIAGFVQAVFEAFVGDSRSD